MSWSNGHVPLTLPGPPVVVQLAGASDLRFTEGLLKFARDGLGLRPALSPVQFLSQVSPQGACCCAAPV